MANRWGNSGNNDQLYFGGAPKSLQMVTAAMKLKKMLTLWMESYDQPRQHMNNLDSIFREDNGNPLQYSCLEHPMGRGAW